MNRKKKMTPQDIMEIRNPKKPEPVVPRTLEEEQAIIDQRINDRIAKLNGTSAIPQRTRKKSRTHILTKDQYFGDRINADFMKEFLFDQDAADEFVLFRQKRIETGIDLSEDFFIHEVDKWPL